jgi:hypothetical protein
MVDSRHQVPVAVDIDFSDENNNNVEMRMNLGPIEGELFI